MPGEGSRGSSRRRRPLPLSQSHPPLAALRAGDVGWSARRTVPGRAAGPVVNRFAPSGGDGQGKAKLGVLASSKREPRVEEGAPGKGHTGQAAPGGGQAEGESRRRARAAAGRGLWSPPAVGGQRAGAGAARAAAARAAFPASRAARGARAGSAGPGARGRFAPPPPRPRPASAAKPLTPLPAWVKPERPTRRLTSLGPAPDTALPGTGPPLRPPYPTPSSLVRVRPSVDFRGLPLPHLAETFCGSLPPHRAAQTWLLGGGGVERAGYKGPEAARAEPRDVARPPCRPHLQVRARPPAESGRVVGVGRDRRGLPDSELVILFVLCDIHMRALVWKLLKDRESCFGFLEELF